MSRCLICLLMLALPGAVVACLEDECEKSSFQERCDGDTFDTCTSIGETWTRHNAVETHDCAGHGQACVDSNGDAACVDRPLVPCAFTSQRCSASARAIEDCTLGYVNTVETCSSDERCIEIKGAASCEKPASLSCTGDGQLCSADRRAVLFCHQGQAYLAGAPCATDEVCVARAAEAACVDAALLACDGSSDDLCSKDRRHVLSCVWTVGYYDRKESCQAPEVCVPVFDDGALCLEPTSAPCPASGMQCSADRSKILYCGGGKSYVMSSCPGQTCAIKSGSPSC